MATEVELRFDTLPTGYIPADSRVLDLGYGGPLPNPPPGTVSPWGIGRLPMPSGATVVRTVLPDPKVRVDLDFSTTLPGYIGPPSNDVPLSFQPIGGVDLGIFPGGEVFTVLGQPLVRNQQMHVGPAGFLAGAVGAGVVRNHLAYVRPAGADQSRYGRPLVVNGFPQAFPVGIPPSGIGRPTVFNFNQEVRPAGLNAFRGFGEHWVSLGIRRITPAGLVATLWGTHTLAGGVRWIDLSNRGITSAAFGSAVAWFFERQVFPLWFVATRYGNARLDFNHDVMPEGILPGRVGTHEVHVPRVIVDVAGRGMAPPPIPLHRVENFVQHAQPIGWMDGGPSEPERFGRGEVINRLQVILQLFAPSPSDGGVFGSFTRVDNRNKLVRTEGRIHAVMGGPSVANKARVVRTLPDQDMARWGMTLVADRIRSVRPRGGDSLAWGSPLGNIVYNAARVVAPAGWRTEVFGQHGPVWSNRQWFRHVGVDQSAFGRGMVSFRVRAVAAFSLPNPPPFGAAVVQHLQRTVKAEGWASFRHGLATLHQRFNIIAAWAVLPPANQMGSNTVRNVTPELKQMGAVATLWGDARIYHRWRSFDMQGFNAQAFGTHVVKDRRQPVLPGGIAPRPISQTHAVRNVLPDPPATRTLGVVGWDSGERRVGTPIVRENAIRPEGFIATQYGMQLLEYMGIAPIGIPPPREIGGNQFGTPSLNAWRTIAPVGVVAPVPPVADVGPRYVWAPRGYPYSTGHWNELGHIMDFYSLFNANGQLTTERPVWGQAGVSHFHRAVTAVGVNAGALGIPALRVNPQYIRMEGSRFQRFGFPKVNAGGVVEAVGKDQAEFGRAIIIEADYGPRTAKPSGIVGLSFGLSEVQLFHRQLLGRGWDSFTISSPAAPSWPRRSHWVSHAYPPFNAQGADMAVYGLPWVSNAIRSVSPAGFGDGAVAEYTPGHFAARMRVRRTGRVVSASVGPAGSVGWPSISMGTRYVWPRALAAGGSGVPLLASTSILRPSGLQAGEFGDIDRWEAGHAKVHGSDMGASGNAIILRGVRAAGFAGTVGAPRVGRPVAPHTFRADAVGVPTAIARWCGNKAMAAQGSAHGRVGIPKIDTGQVSP
ncbi:TPA: hypothetical protein UN285_000425 [Stenotrophomonas maltophilia]|uniref:hypothetical protein n=1 Tax=Stenotrophomonas maltophilia TaxID=40324 RepID=UPI0013DBBAC1|nr:hypothetical protein [Stenotrophomonas maltophilia]EKU9979178.1 hypothetical protein [Stenotrophomonas maltophilia]EKX6271048.1 hypothetical protein [Stenotrophomonas maltophilia]MBS6054041.1 hypothetical protein [Stenotrophomonas maltophilia]MDG9766168.1 hypothetical protein [Stenotrophomonas maltophilia]MDG9908432.1 hypothetical protein [Stenotrophomonas maltophilia]